MATVVIRRPYPPSVLSMVPMEGKPAPVAPKKPASKAVASKKAAKKSGKKARAT